MKKFYIIHIPGALLSGELSKEELKKLLHDITAKGKEILSIEEF